MKIFDKLFNALGLYEYVETDEPDEIVINRKKEETDFYTKPANSGDFSEREQLPWLKQNSEKKVTPPAAPVSNIVSLPVTNQQVKVVVVEPRVFDDAQSIADHVRAAKPVVVNFEKTDPDIMKRIVDFISGTVYALNGNIQLVGNNIMVCAPNNVDIDLTKDFWPKKDFEPWRK